MQDDVTCNTVSDLIIGDGRWQQSNLRSFAGDANIANLQTCAPFRGTPVSFLHTPAGLQGKRKYSNSLYALIRINCLTADFY